MVHYFKEAKGFAKMEYRSKRRHESHGGKMDLKRRLLELLGEPEEGQAEGAGYGKRYGAEQTRNTNIKTKNNVQPCIGNCRREKSEN